MNMNIDVTEIISIVITLLGVLITTFVIPYIKSKTNDAQYNLIKTIVNTAVYFAEAYFNSSYGQGEEKRKYVIEYAKGKCSELGLTFDEVAVAQLIEEAWINLTDMVSDVSLIEDKTDSDDEGEIISE